jgi:transposase
MAYNLLPYDREQDYLLPPSLREWLGEEDLAWFIVDAVGQLDLTQLYAAYRDDGWGAAAYDPALLTAILLYAYCRGIRSSRQMADGLKRDLGFRVVAANQQPDFRTLCRFRSRHQQALQDLFVQVLVLCKKAGLLKLGAVALDGTKVAANASFSANRTRAGLEAEVRRMLDEAKAVDAEEDARYGPERQGDELPEGLGRRNERLQRLREAKARLEQEAQQERERAAKEAEAAARGKRLPGRPRKPQAGPPKEPRANTTDPDSRTMKTRNGFVQGYNVQAVVNGVQIVLALGVTQQATDVLQLVPMLERTEANLAAIGIMQRPQVGLADAGYASEANFQACAAGQTEWFIALQKDWKQRKGRRSRARIPKTLSERERMQHRLSTKRGRRLYRRRSVIVEPAFGQMKERQGFRRFQRRGMEAVTSEATLVATCHNLLKLWRAKRRVSPRLSPGTRPARQSTRRPLRPPSVCNRRWHQRFPRQTAR